MSNQYRLVELGNSQLLAGLSELVQRSNLLTGQLLAHLVELEERKLHLELGFSSLFAYCVEALGMSEGTAGRRVAAARVCRRFPEVFERVARGELHLCALCALAPHLKPENTVELFAACKGKTRRQVEELLAARFPRPDVREQIRRLPTRAPLPATRGQVLPPSVIAQPISARKAPEGSIVPPNPARSADSEVSTIPSNPALPAAPDGSITSVISPRHSTIPPNPAPRAARVTVLDARRRTREFEPLSGNRFGVHFTADAELRELIERARALASHRLSNGDLAGLMKLIAASFVQQEEKRRFGIGAKPKRARSEEKSARAALPETPPGGVPQLPGDLEPSKREPVAVPAGKRGRYLPVTVRRETHGRDRGQCAFVSKAGRRCRARAFLEFDHVKPFARSGAPDAVNIRLLCTAHNLLHAHNCFGAMHITAKIAAKSAVAKLKRAEEIVGRRPEAWQVLPSGDVGMRI